MNPTKLYRKLIPWKVGDTCAVQLLTKKVYAVIIRFGRGRSIVEGKRDKFFPYVEVEYETRSPIPHRQYVDMRDLLEDDRE
jgi:hypothetical protein